MYNRVQSLPRGGYTSMVQAIPTVTAGAYAAGTVIGGPLALVGSVRDYAGSGLVQSVGISFTSGVQPSLDVVLANSPFTTSVVTNGSVLQISTADLANIIGVIHLTDATLLGATAPSYIEALGQALPFVLPGTGDTLYALVVTRSAVTLTSTSDMTFSLRVIQD